MPLHPQAQALVNAMAAMPPLDPAALPLPALRAAMNASGAYAPGDAVARIEERVIDGPGGPLRLRLFVPEASGPWPVTLFFHGGGFVVCNLDTHDNLCRCLAQRAGTLVVSVDYRLAPEAKFPAAVDDACAALRWVHAHAATLGGDATRLAVAGDSAGGNLAAVAAQWAPAQGITLAHQLLLYPVTDAGMHTASYRAFAEGYVLSATMMRWFFEQYLPGPQSVDDARASPLRARSLAGLAPATVFTAEYDPLCDEGEAYAEALRAAGVDTQLHRWPGQIHGFISMLGALDDADRALTAAAAALRRRFAAAPQTATARHSGRSAGAVPG
ncbi:MAG: alpha/beta hydrolase [Nevskiaceae bacterium]|nr:MAG: alpha/beta hydrolase [Nevskiaceae bacterium]